jgi:uncharacterized protein (TIRG00374 family)
LLRPIKHIKTLDLLPITAIGFMANNVLPLRTGEIVRSFVLSRNHKIRKTSALATVAIERVFDGLTMVAFMLIAAMTIDFTSDLRHVMTIAVVLFAIAVTVLAVMTFAHGLRVKLVSLGLRFMPELVRPRAERLIDSFFDGLEALRSGKAIAGVAISSVAAWLLEASMYYVIARAFGGSVEAVMGVAETLLTTGVANLATLVPSSPGYVGPFEAGVKTALEGALGVPSSQALSYAILVHAALWFPITLIGAVEWSRMHVSLKQISAEDNGTAPAVTPISTVESKAVTQSHARSNAA